MQPLLGLPCGIRSSFGLNSFLRSGPAMLVGLYVVYVFLNVCVCVGGGGGGEGGGKSISIQKIRLPEFPVANPPDGVS